MKFIHLGNVPLFVILDFSDIIYSEKPIMKVHILMTGIINTELTPIGKCSAD